MPASKKTLIIGRYKSRSCCILSRNSAIIEKAAKANSKTYLGLSLINKDLA